MHIIGVVLLIISFLLMFNATKQHKEETGVNAPTRKQMSYIRRQARKRGLSDHKYYEIWLKNKQKRNGTR